MQRNLSITVTPKWQICSLWINQVNRAIKIEQVKIVAADNFYPLSVFFLDSHWSESYHVYSGDAADFVTQPRHLVMANYEENDKNDFIFLGLADWSRERKEVSIPPAEEVFRSLFNS